MAASNPIATRASSHPRQLLPDLSRSAVLRNFQRRSKDNRVSEYAENTRFGQQNQLILTLVSGASLIVGLHCDGAAEPIVGFALAHNKAFVLFPAVLAQNSFLNDG